MWKPMQCTFLFTVLFCASDVISSKNNMSVHIERIKLDSDSKFLNISGNIRETEDGLNMVDVSIDMHHNVDTKVYIESEIFMKTNGEFTSFIMGPAVDICEFFKNPKLNPMLAMIMQTMNKYGNKMTSCPIHTMKFDIVGFRMDSTTLPSFVPSGEYRMEVKTSRELTGSTERKMLMQFDCDARLEKSQ